MSCAGVPRTIVQVIKRVKKLSEDTQTRAFSLHFRARGIEGARLSERREKQHLHKKCEIVARVNLRRSSIATSDPQVMVTVKLA